MNPLQPLLDRRSYGFSKLEHPGPSDDELRNLFDLVMTTPDHGNVKPWRFLVARGDNMQKIADFSTERFKMLNESGELSEADLNYVRDIASIPMLIIAVTDLDTEHHVSLWDQRLCVAAATQNIMNGLHLLGYGGLWYTFLASDEMKPMLGMQPEDQIVGIIAAGTPDPHFVKNIKRQAPNKYCFEWQGIGVAPTPLFKNNM